MSTLTLPTILTLPSASAASQSFTVIATNSLTQLRIFSGVSTSSLLLAYFLSPKRSRHPYLLWTSLAVGLSGVTDLLLRPTSVKTIRTIKERKPKRGVESSYEVLGDSHSDISEEVEDFNGEEVRAEMEEFRFSQTVRTGISAVGFAMAVLGIWGDGA